MTGVDVKAEMEREQRLKEESMRLGLNPGTGIGDQIRSGTYRDPAVNALADGLNAAMEHGRGAANQAASDAALEFANNVGNGAAAANAEIQALQAQLEMLRTKAAEQRANANAANNGVPGGAGAGPGGVGSASAAMFSAAGILAATQGTVVGRQTAILERQDKKLAKANELLEAVVVAMKNNGLVHA
jgi:hypothetical protein